MQNKKLMTIPIVLMLALLTVGFAYAHWSQILYIEGTVDTGSFTVGIIEKSCAEKYYDPNTGTYEDGEWEGKDVGKIVKCEWGQLKTDPITGKSGYDSVVVEIENAYPCYRVHVTICISNLGTVPAHIVDIVTTGRDETEGKDLGFEWIPGYKYEDGFFWQDFNDNGKYDDGEEVINVHVSNFVCEQIDPCHDIKGEIDFHFKQGIKQGHTYTFEVGLVAIQWNEA